MPKKFVRDARRARAALAAASANGGGIVETTEDATTNNVVERSDPNLVSGQVEIGAGTQYEIPVLAYEGCILVWSFKTIGGDIGFGLSFKADESAKGYNDVEDDSKTNEVTVNLTPGEEIIIAETKRFKSDELEVHGTVQIAKAGTITLKWDNSYSYFKGKQLEYSVELEEPLGSQHGPRALGGPDTPRIFFVLGGPGAGKGTQCTNLAKQFGLLHISAGDLLRAEREDPESEHFEIINSCIKEGKIVPVEITVALLWKAIRQSGRRFVLVDGFPRNRDNLEGWHRKIGGRAHVVCAISFEVPEDVLISRLLDRGKNSGRDDDNLETIKKRLDTFTKETRPILDYFSARGQLVKIDGNRGREVVFEELIQEMTNKLNNQKLPPIDDFILAAPRNRIAPRVILGTMNIGGEGLNEVEAKEYLREFSMTDPACDEIDTARLYSNGNTEEILGKILVSGKTRIASKVNPFPGNGNSLTPKSIASQLNETLSALKTECLDILYLHAPDKTTPIEQTLEACDTLHRSGKFKELGLSNFPAWQVVNSYHICASRGWIRPTVYQGMYNALTRDVEHELLPALRTLGIRFYAFNPLAGGLLTSKYTHLPSSIPEEGRFSDNTTLGAIYRERYFKPNYFASVSDLDKICKSFGIPLHDASLRWLAHHSSLRTTRADGIILGASNSRQLKENIRSVRGNGPLPLPIVVAFDIAWENCKGETPKYFRE